jgi:hypothetical protein
MASTNTVRCTNGFSIRWDLVIALSESRAAGIAARCIEE